MPVVQLSCGCHWYIFSQSVKSFCEVIKGWTILDSHMAPTANDIFLTKRRLYKYSKECCWHNTELALHYVTHRHQLGTRRLENKSTITTRKALFCANIGDCTQRAHNTIAYNESEAQQGQEVRMQMQATYLLLWQKWITFVHTVDNFAEKSKKKKKWSQSCSPFVRKRQKMCQLICHVKKKCPYREANWLS